MDGVRGKCLVFAIIWILFACLPPNKTGGRNDGTILISSKLDEDICNLKINDSLYFFNKKIETDRSLGIDRENWIRLKSVDNPIRISAIFEGTIMQGNESLKPVKRKIELDTIFDLGKGKYLILEAGVKKVNLGYSKKPIFLN